jgi:hypothetical protein
MFTNKEIGLSGASPADVDRACESRESRFGSLLQTILLIGLIATVPLYLLLSYLGFNYLTSLSFNVADGNCDSATEALGQHCFGDYSIFLNSQGSRIDELARSLYPPLGRLPHWITGFSASSIGLGPTRILYLILLVACLILPIIVSTRGWEIQKRLLALLTLSVATLPFIATIDRGNSLALCVPLLFGLGLALMRQSWSTAVGLACLLAFVRPQFLVLGVVILLLTRVRVALLTLSLSVLGIIAPFWLLGGRPALNEWLGNLSAYGNQDLLDTYPANVSPPTAITQLILVLLPDVSSATLFDALQLLVICVMAGSFASFFLVAAQERRPLTVLAVAISAILTIPSTSQGYYLALALPIAALALADSRGQEWRWPTLWLLGALAASLTPLMLPMPLEVQYAGTSTGIGGVVINGMPRLAGLLWLAYAIGVMVSNLLSLRRSGKGPRSTCQDQQNCRK